MKMEIKNLRYPSLLKINLLRALNFLRFVAFSHFLTSNHLHFGFRKKSFSHWYPNGGIFHTSFGIIGVIIVGAQIVLEGSYSSIQDLIQYQEVCQFADVSFAISASILSFCNQWWVLGQSVSHENGQNKGTYLFNSHTSTNSHLTLTFIFIFDYRLIASDCKRKWRMEAEYLRFIHGFLQSAPQLVLQSVILLKGIHIHSLHQTVEAIQKALADEDMTLVQAFTFLTQDRPIKWYWGLIQVVSLLLSFLSTLQTLIQFNEWSKRRHTLHRLVLVVPFFAITILYRVAAMALVLAFGGHLALLPILGLLLTQVRICHEEFLLCKQKIKAH